MAEISNKIVKEKRTRSEQILDDIERQLRSLISEKKKIQKDFVENKKAFENNLREAERIENKLMLLWDYWRREVEISNLRKIESQSLPIERDKVLKEIKRLNDLNITLEKGFRKRKIDAKVVEELRKRLEVWEDEEVYNI